MFKEPLGDKFGPIPTYVEVGNISPQNSCPACGSTNIRRNRKAPSRRVFLHADNGQLKKIILIRPRYECRDCKSTFYPSTNYFANNSSVTAEAADTITKTILEHPEVSINSVAENIEKLSGMSSSSAIDRLIKKRVRDLSDAVQLIACHKLFYIPFKYKSRTNCCAIVGFKKSEKKLYLLDILQSSSSEQLEKFFIKINFFKKDAKLFLADLNGELLASIKSNYEGRVGVLRGLILQRISSYQDKHFAINKKYNALEELKNAVLADLKEKYYYESFEQWEKDYLMTEPALTTELKPLYDEIVSLKKECWIGTHHRPWEPEFTMLLSTIKTCERNNASFDFMAFRLLYANRAATKTLDGGKLMRYVQSINIPIDSPLRSFGVEIRELYQEVNSEDDYIFALLKQITF